MSGQPCPGKCNSRWWKAQAEYRKAEAAYDPLDPATSRPAPPDESLIREWGQPVWCSKHTAEIGEQLAQLDDLANIYAQAADGHHTAPLIQRVGGSAVMLSQSEIHDQLDELTSVITSWELAYRQLIGLPEPPPRGDDATVQATCIAWLSRNRPGILAGPLAEDIGRGILTWRSIIAGKAKASPRTILLPGRCPGRGCGQRLLTWTEGTNRVECGNPDCRKIMTKDDYDAEVECQVRLHQELYHRGRECDCALRRVS